jgi:PAS domain S-box-containing protein
LVCFDLIDAITRNRCSGDILGRMRRLYEIPKVSSNLAQLCTEMERGVGVLVIAEEAIVADSQPLVSFIEQQPVWSDLPIILLTRTGRQTAALDDIAARLGNVSLVERPIGTSTLMSLVRSSLRARGRQYEVREYLAQQVNAQRAIREGERRYRSVIENITDYAIFMTDAAGRITNWNEGAETMLGFSADEIIGRPIETLSTLEDAGAGLDERDLLTARETGKCASERWRVRKDGGRLYIEGVCAAVVHETGLLSGFAHFFCDVTARHQIELEREHLLESERAARSEAERASRMKDEFLATLSHELRTPLNAILGWTQVLRKTQKQTDDSTNALNVIERNARAQAQIIADLLEMSSIISGKLRLEVQELNLPAIVDATIETVRPAAEAKGIRLQVARGPMIGSLRGDPNRLQQVFWNLLTNAVKFTPKSGCIDVVLSQTESHFEVEVTDNGEGIDQKFLPYIFERFRQADASTTRRHGGLGLGLSIVKQLVELHGGSVTAMSAGKGSGSTFCVKLPLMPQMIDPAEKFAPRELPSPSRRGPLPEAVTEADLAGLKVLVVDDEPDARSLIQRLLENRNASVITAASAAEAIERISGEVPDVLVSDIGMPGEDGYSLIRKVRALPGEGARVPAIALTAYARLEDRVKAVSAGFQLHLSKPVEPVELAAMIQSLVRRPEPTERM